MDRRRGKSSSTSQETQTKACSSYTLLIVVKVVFRVLIKSRDVLAASPLKVDASPTLPKVDGTIRGTRRTLEVKLP